MKSLSSSLLLHFSFETLSKVSCNYEFVNKKTYVCPIIAGVLHSQTSCSREVVSQLTTHECWEGKKELLQRDRTTRNIAPWLCKPRNNLFRVIKFINHIPCNTRGASELFFLKFNLFYAHGISLSHRFEKVQSYIHLVLLGL